MENTIQPNVEANKATPTRNVPVAPNVSTQQVAADIEKIRNEASQAIAASADVVRQAAASLSARVTLVEPALKITVDDAVDIPVVTVVDQGSNKVIRQIPNEEVVALARFMQSQSFDDYGSSQELRGLLLDNRT